MGSGSQELLKSAEIALGAATAVQVNGRNPVAGAPLLRKACQELSTILAMSGAPAETGELASYCESRGWVLSWQRLQEDLHLLEEAFQKRLVATDVQHSEACKRVQDALETLHVALASEGGGRRRGLAQRIVSRIGQSAAIVLSVVFCLVLAHHVLGSEAFQPQSGVGLPSVADSDAIQLPTNGGAPSGEIQIPGPASFDGHTSVDGPFFTVKMLGPVGRYRLQVHARAVPCGPDSGQLVGEEDFPRLRVSYSGADLALQGFASRENHTFDIGTLETGIWGDHVLEFGFEGQREGEGCRRELWLTGVTLTQLPE